MCTGNAKEFMTSRRLLTVYPCVYRERGRFTPGTTTLPGLSLCVQGTLESISYWVWHNAVYPCVYRERVTVFWPITRSARFIPVCTGNANTKSAPLKSEPVYPCVYRERLNQPFSQAMLNGLSLCVQGTPVASKTPRIFSRFIPVCTGNAQYNWIRQP